MTSTLLDKAIEAVKFARAPKEPPAPLGPEVEDAPELERPNCPLCGSTRATSVLFAHDDWMQRRDRRFSIVRCGVCAVRYTTPRYRFEHKALAFQGPYPFYEKARAQDAATSLRRRAFLSRARALMEHEPRPGRLLDLGSGDGLFLDVMRERGWEVQGVDVEPDVVRFANEHLRVPCTVLDVEVDPLPEGPFEVVTMWGLLQLLYFPQRFLERVRHVLKPDGLLAIGVSNIRSLGALSFGANWRGLGLPRHLLHFTPHTLRRLLNWSGYRVESLVFETPKWIVAGSVDALLPDWVPAKKWVRIPAYAAGSIFQKSVAGDTMMAFCRPDPAWWDRAEVR